jgi:hypothetical protein
VLPAAGKPVRVVAGEHAGRGRDQAARGVSAVRGGVQDLRGVGGRERAPCFPRGAVGDPRRARVHASRARRRRLIT